MPIYFQEYPHETSVGSIFVPKPPIHSFPFQSLPQQYKLLSILIPHSCPHHATNCFHSFVANATTGFASGEPVVAFHICPSAFLPQEYATFVQGSAVTPAGG